MANTAAPSTMDLQREWGELAATHLLKAGYPNLASATRPRLGVDCSQFFAMLEKDTSLSAPMSEMCKAFEEAMSHLVSAKDELQNTCETKTALIEELSTSLVRTRSGNSAAGSRRQSQDPEKFGGTEKDIAKRQQQYVNWRSQINRCFGVDRHIFDTEYRKIQHISGLLKDDAYDRTREYFDTVTEYPDDPEYWHWKTATEVFWALNDQYETMDLSQQASQDFDDLWMTNKPFQNFLAEFERLAHKCGKTQEQKVEALRVKVSQEVSDELAHQINVPVKSNFKGWADLCQKAYNSLENKKHVDKLRAARPGGHRQQQNINRQQNSGTRAAPSPAVPDHNTGDPMMLDAIRLPRPSREQCQALDLCFYCKKPGHRKDDCEERKQANIRWGSQQWTGQRQYGQGRQYTNTDLSNPRAPSPSYASRGPTPSASRTPSPMQYGQRQQNNYLAPNPLRIGPYNRLRGFIEGEVASPPPSFDGYTPDETLSAQSKKE